MANIVEMPKLGFDMAEGKLASWVIPEQGKVEKGNVLAEIETDKATVEVESSFTGVFKHLAKEGESLPVGAPIAVISDEGEDVDLEKILERGKKADAKTKVGAEESAPQIAPDKEVERLAADPDGAFIKASPVAKRMAQEKNIELSTLRKRSGRTDR